MIGGTGRKEGRNRTGRVKKADLDEERYEMCGLSRWFCKRRKININAEIKKKKRYQKNKWRESSEDESANLIGLFGAVGGLKGIDETF